MIQALEKQIEQVHASVHVLSSMEAPLVHGQRQPTRPSIRKYEHTPHYHTIIYDSTQAARAEGKVLRTHARSLGKRFCAHGRH